MSEAVDRESLLRTSTIIDLLDAGWRPGNAELETARYVQNWAILPSSVGIPYRMRGIAWTLPVSCELIDSGVIALDRIARWARLWDEWVVISDPVDGMPEIDDDAIRRANAAWLLTEIRRWPALA